jgi:hypothetical protein
MYSYFQDKWRENVLLTEALVEEISLSNVPLTQSDPLSYLWTFLIGKRLLWQYGIQECTLKMCLWLLIYFMWE